LVAGFFDTGASPALSRAFSRGAPSLFAMSCSVAYCLAMSTLALEKLPKTFASLVREGKLFI
jgi:hypothetical protein